MVFGRIFSGIKRGLTKTAGAFGGVLDLLRGQEEPEDRGGLLELRTRS